MKLLLATMLTMVMSTSVFAESNRNTTSSYDSTRSDTTQMKKAHETIDSTTNRAVVPTVESARYEKKHSKTKKMDKYNKATVDCSALKGTAYTNCINSTKVRK